VPRGIVPSLRRLGTRAVGPARVRDPA